MNSKSHRVISILKESSMVIWDKFCVYFVDVYSVLVCMDVSFDWKLKETF